MSTPTGWECPKCGTVHAPSVCSCAACSTASAIEREPRKGPNFPPRLEIADDCKVTRFEIYVGGVD